MVEWFLCGCVEQSFPVRLVCIWLKCKWYYRTHPIHASGKNSLTMFVLQLLGTLGGKAMASHWLAIFSFCFKWLSSDILTVYLYVILYFAYLSDKTYICSDRSHKTLICPTRWQCKQLWTCFLLIMERQNIASVSCIKEERASVNTGNFDKSWK